MIFPFHIIEIVGKEDINGWIPFINYFTRQIDINHRRQSPRENPALLGTAHFGEELRILGRTAHFGETATETVFLRDLVGERTCEDI